jgi:hypothetical protein
MVERCSAFNHTHTSVSVSSKKRTKKPIYSTIVPGIIAYPSLIEMSREKSEKNEMFFCLFKTGIKLRYFTG